MDSWWRLGEGMGHFGADLSVYRITCPFCLESGNFKTVGHFEKKQPNDSKKLNFDTLECGSCKGYVMVLWSAGDRLHDFRVLPWPLRLESHPEHWPKTVGRFWIQAHRNLGDQNWDAAAVMARSAMQAALRDKKATGSNLKQEIESLAKRGELPPLMKEWSDNVRELGNDSAHPGPTQPGTDPEDARDVVQFLDFLLEYAYNLPRQIEDFRRRSDPK